MFITQCNHFPDRNREEPGCGKQNKLSTRENNYSLGLKNRKILEKHLEQNKDDDKGIKDL